MFRAGYETEHLGTQMSLPEVCAAARDAGAVLVSIMDGHARYWLRDLPTVRLDHPGGDARWYLGGHPALHDGPEQVAELLALGFDRVLTDYLPAEQVVAMLRRECPGLTVGPPGRAAPRRAHRDGGPAAGPPEGAPRPEGAGAEERAEVLAQWHTGSSAADLVRNCEVLTERTSLSRAQLDADTEARTLVQPRCGVAGVVEQQELLRVLQVAGADVLSLQIDSLTRNNAYPEVELALKEAEAGAGAASGGPPVTSQLNGYPAVNQGVAQLRAITAEFHDVPMQVRHSTRDPRLLAEISFAGGITAYEGGALSYNLPYYRDLPPAESVRRWRYVDALAGRYHAERGLILDREFFGVLTAALVPPSMAVVVNVLEALLAAEQGVRSVSLGYAEQGCQAQDVAAMRVLCRLGRRYLDRHGHPDVAVHTVFHQYMGAFPTDPDRARALVAGSADTARRSGATRVLVKTAAEARRIPTGADNAEAIALVRTELTRRDPGPGVDPQVDREEEVLEAEASAVLETVLRAGRRDPGAAAVLGVERGFIDIPFSPNHSNAGLAVTLRDAGGAVRFADPGRIPLPPDVAAHHRDQLRRRLHADRRRALPELVETDVLGVADRHWSQWPLRGPDAWIEVTR